MTRAPPEPGSVEYLQQQGGRLMKRLCQRVQWLLDMARRHQRTLSPDVVMKIIAADRSWAEDANSFMKDAEGKVSEMLAQHPQKFNAFRELQKKGVQWPHTSQLRRAIENAGFVFRPMMIKRDRCICETCGVEVSGWRPWHNPWAFHNFAKHPPTFTGDAFKAGAMGKTGATAAGAGNGSGSGSGASAKMSTTGLPPRDLFPPPPLPLPIVAPPMHRPSKSSDEKRKLLHARFNSTADIQSVLTLAPNPNLPWPAQTYYVMSRHLHNRTTTLISSFQLCDATNGKDNKPTGIEVMAECPESDIPGDVESSWIFDLVHEISHQTAQRGPLLRQQLDQLGWISFNIPDIKVPAPYLDPVTKDCAVILGLVSPSLPKFFILENESVRLVTIRLLKNTEWELIRDHGQGGRQLLAERFAKDGTYHLSTIATPPPPPPPAPASTATAAPSAATVATSVSSAAAAISSNSSSSSASSSSASSSASSASSVTKPTTTPSKSKSSIAVF